MDSKKPDSVGSGTRQNFGLVQLLQSFTDCLLFNQNQIKVMGFKIPNFRYKRNFTKMLLIMKLTAILLFSIIFQVYATGGYSQKVSIEMKNVPLKTVFKEIQKQTGYYFLYSEELLENTKNVDLFVQNSSLEDALNKCLQKTSLTYSIVEKTIVIKLTLQQPDIAFVLPQPPLNFEVSGVLVDDESKPLEGASVKLKGTNKGVTTDKNGKFSIKVPDDGATLVLSYVGFESLEIKVTKAEVLQVKLKKLEGKSEDIVVVGYGTQKRASVTGSITSVKGETLVKNPTSNIAQSLQGRLPGLIVNLRTGESGLDNAEILIRGKGTLGYNSPLIVIDGVVGFDDMQRINPNDVESITVLKDASAAIYGAQAANGVILVTRKRGKIQKPTLTYTGNLTFTQPTRLPKLMSSSQYAQAENEYLQSAGQPKKWTDVDIKAWQDNTDPIGHPNTNWMEEVYKKWTPQYINTLSLTGGTDNVKYYLSGQLTKEDANFKRNDGLAYKQRQFHAAIDLDVTKDLTVSVDLNTRVQDKQSSFFGSGNSQVQIFLQSPITPAYYPNGLEGPSQFGYNPVLLGTKVPGYTNTITGVNTIKGSFKWKLNKLLKGLYADGFAASSKTSIDYKRFQKIWYVYSYDKSTNEYVPIRGGQESINPNLQQQESKAGNTTYNIKLGYQQKFGKHSIDGFVAYEQNEGNGFNISATRRDYTTDQIEQLFAGSSVGLTNNGSAYENARQNYFGRFNYGYNNKYYLNVTMRYDGSQNFPSSNRFGLFPSISAAWRISQEDFMKKVVFINDLKIRGSWGKMGNDAIPPFQYLATYQYGLGYYFGQNAILNPGLILSRAPNEKITWEVANSKNIGFEAILFDNKFSLNVDYFKSVRDNILIRRNASVPDYAGLTLPDENLGKISNSGFEIEANYNSNIRKDFKFNIGGNISYAKNKIIFIDESPNVPEYQKRTGYPIDANFLYQADGLFQNQSEIDKYPHLPNTAPGDIKYVDINKDGAITAADQIRTFVSPTPQVVYGANIGGNYKNWELMIFFQGQAKANASIKPLRLYENKAFFEGRWQKEGDNLYPRAFVSNRDPIGVNALPSTFWLRNTSFLRLKNVQIAYNFPVNIINKLGISATRIYLSGTNLFTIDKIKILDPENANFNGEIYPLQRTVNFGINVTF